MKLLQWSQNQVGNYNGKVGVLTLFVVAYHTGENRWMLLPKLPGFKSVPVGSILEGQRRAAALYQSFMDICEVS